MYFKQIEEIMNGTKTQTRRVVKPGEFEKIIPAPGDPVFFQGDDIFTFHSVNESREIASVYSKTKNRERLKWAVEKDYCVSPGRGKPGLWIDLNGAIIYDPLAYCGAHGCKPLRIVITAIRRERLQAITEADAVAEGYPNTPPQPGITMLSPIEWYRELWTAINGRGSWKSNPLVWALTFEVKA